MDSNVDNLIREAIQAHRSGNNEQARKLLLEAVEADEKSEQAWLWLSAVVDSSEDQQTCLENVLTINPNNEKAQQGLRILREKTTDSLPPEPAKPQSNLLPEYPDAEDDPFANVSFTPSPDESQAFETPFASFGDDAAVEEDDEELPDVSAWGLLETSSASAQRPANEPSSVDYNEWIDNLKIGNSEAPDAFGVSTDDASTTSPFIGNADAEDNEPFELDADIFNFKQDTFSKPPEDLAEAAADSNPFGDFDFDDDLNDEPFAPAASVSSVVTSPADAEELEDFEIGDSFDDDDDFLLDDDDDDFDLIGADPEELFRLIPAEIKITRMPGTNERYPASLIISLVLLVLFNMGAIALVFLTLSGGLT